MLQRQAEALLHRGHRSEAVLAYRVLLSAAPADAGAWFNLGYLLRHGGDHEEALTAYRQALRCGIAHPEEAHLNCAVLLSDHLGRPDSALGELKRALELAPDYVPALLNLGNLQEELGQREAALATYSQLIKRTKDQSNSQARFEALARITHLSPPSALHDPLLEELHKAVSSSAENSTLNSTLRFALGRSYDRLGAYAQAFQEFAAANRIAHREHVQYHAEGAERTTSAICSAFNCRERPSLCNDAGAPLFICGMFRSGSTLLEQVLSIHPDVVAGGELDLVPRLVRDHLPTFPNLDQRERGVDYRALAGKYLSGRHSRLGPTHYSSYVTDKRLDNIAYIGLIKRMFPSAKIIFTRRHPMATGLSVFMQHINPARFRYAGRLEDIGHALGEQSRLMEHWRNLFPGDIHDFDYDQFIDYPDATLRSLLSFLDLPWHPDCLQFHTSNRIIKTASYWQVRQPLHGRALRHWQNYSEWLHPLAKTLRTAGFKVPENEMVNTSHAPDAP